MFFRWIGVLFELWILVGFVGSVATFGQGFQSRINATEGMLLPAPREIEALLEDAREAVSRQQWSEATLALGTVLGLEAKASAADSGQDYFLFREQEERVAVDGTVIRTAHELLSQLPDEGQKVVELRYGVQAAQMLEEAVANWDWGRIQTIASRYQFTRAGQEASLMLAERALGDGNVREAATVLARLHAMESARRRFGESLGVMTTAVSQAAKMQNAARSALKLTRAESPSFTTEWNGSKIGWNEKTSDESILQSLDQPQATIRNRPVPRPAYPGGDPLRNAETQAGLPLPILRWHVELHESFQHKDNLDRSLKKQLSERKSVLIPTRYPIAVDSWVIVPTYDQRVLAIDAKTGLIGWPCVFSGMPLGFSLDRFTTRDAFSLGMPAPDYLVRRVWGDVAVGQIASDGERLFTLSELPAVDVAESFAQGPNARLMRNSGIKTFNVLQAWSIQDQGKLLWEVGGASGGKSPEMAGALFLGAPLPYRGELLCLIELNGEIFLVSHAPETGKMLWRQPIAANQGTTISLDPQRRSYGASPSADGSIIVCPTLSGYLVAYDMNSRELLWQYRYSMNPNLTPGASFNFIGGMDARESNPTIPRSVETSVLMHDGVVIFAPSNGNSVSAIDLADGSELWQISFDDPTPFRYIAGVFGDIVALVQNGAVLGIDLRSGKTKWGPLAIPGDAQIVGRSVRQGKKLLVPTSNQDILEIDLTNGSLVNAVHVSKPLGNLLVVDDRLISASPFQLDCYSIRDVFETQLLQELNREGETVRSLVKQGELSIASGDIDGALGVLEKALASMPNDPEVRLRLVEVAAMALRNDFDKYVDRVQRYQDLTLDLDLPSYLRILIHGLEKQSRWEETMVKLLELSDARLNRRIDQMSDGQDIDMNPRWSVQEDRWIATRIARCAEKLTPESWQRLEGRFQQRLSLDLNRDRGLDKLRLEHLQSLPQSEPLRLAVAQSLVKSSALESERLLEQGGNREGNPESLSREREDLLAEIYLRSNRPFLAFQYLHGDVNALQKLIEKMAKDARAFSVRGDIAPREITQFASLAKSLETKHTWPEGVVSVSTEFADQGAMRAFDPMSDASSLCTKVESIGDAFANWQVYHSSNGFQFLNTVTTEQFQQLIDAGSMDRSTIPRVYAVDSLVLLELRNQLVAIDTFVALNNPQESQLWRNSFGDESQEVERGRGRSNVIDRNVWGLPIQRRTFRVAAVSRHGAVILNNDELQCLDLFTGNRLWSQTGFRNATFLRDGDTLYAFQPSTGETVHLDIRDGMILQSKDAGQAGWLPIASIGKRWLFGPERSPNGDRASEMKLRLVDPPTGKVLLEREHTPDTRLALVDAVGVAALRTDGQLTYWNAADATEHISTVDVEGKFSTLTAQVFGDVALILPYAGSMELERIAVSPSTRTDPSVAPCAGRLFAISLQEGKPLWERSQRVKHFLFPLSQSRESPAAVFVRRLSLTKVRGQNLDFTSMAMVDVKTGRLLYQKHDLPAMRGDAFRQQLIPGENTMVVKYLGNTLTARWSDDTSGLAPADQTDEIGDLDPDTYRDEIEKKLDGASRSDGK
ncbi:MAG: PQQ-binding-like beta-propeller repeat protein [Planctomycetota bacterium]